MAELDYAETREAIVMGVASGKSVREVAREFMTSERAVREVVTEECHRAASGEAMREQWFLEAKRLEAAGLKCFNRGMEGAGDYTALGIYAKLVERRAILAGANAPMAHVLAVTTQTAPIEESSTTYYRRLLDGLQNYAPRERELEDMDASGKQMTVDEAAELDRFRDEREERRRAEHDARRAARKADPAHTG